MVVVSGGPSRWRGLFGGVEKRLKLLWQNVSNCTCTHGVKKTQILALSQ